MRIAGILALALDLCSWLEGNDMVTLENYGTNRYSRGNEDVTSISDYGFTKMQWHRRKQEGEWV